MAKRPATTLLAVTSRFVARIDFGAAPTPSRLGFWQADATSDAGLRESVRAALSLGPRGVRDVWLLTDHLWTQRVYFASSVMEGLGAEQLQRAIGFEVESFSSIPGLNSRIGVRSQGVVQGSEAFWVTQIQNDHAEDASAIICAAGGRLLGIVHPGGLPVPLASRNKTESFSRVEIWSPATVCVEKTDEQPAQVRIVNAAPSQEQWRQSVENWLGRVTTPSTEWLAAVEANFPVPVVRPLRHVSALTGEELAGFLELWGRELSAPSPRVPVIALPPLPVKVGLLAGVAALLLAGALLACAVWNQVLRQELKQAEAQQAEITRAQQQSAQLAAQIEIARKQVQQTELGLLVPAEAPEKPDEIRRQQERWPAMLTAIADGTRNTVVVDNLTAEPGGGVRIEGVCLQPADADDLAAKLSQALTAKGWKVGAADKWAWAGMDGTPIWQYRIPASPQIQDAAPASPNVSPPTAKSAGAVNRLNRTQ